MAIPGFLKYAFIWILPLVSALTWLAMLLTMFIVWEVEGHPHYPSMSANQTIAYISDIGAQGLKPLFIAGCCITTIFLDLSFASERWLRHTGRLAKNLGLAEKVLSGLSMVFALAGTCGLILLSIYDTLHYPHLHDGFLLLFIAGYIISAIFICAEYQRLGVHFRQHRILRLSFWMKLGFVIVEICLAIVFAATSFDGQPNVAAVFEWIIAIIFTFYILTFFIDLLPAAKSQQAHSNEVMMPTKEVEDGNFMMDNKGYSDGHANGNAGYSDGQVNGANGHANGHANGNAGYSDGHVNGANGNAGYPDIHVDGNGNAYDGRQIISSNQHSIPAAQNF